VVQLVILLVDHEHPFRETRPGHDQLVRNVGGKLALVRFLNEPEVFGVLVVRVEVVRRGYRRTVVLLVVGLTSR